MCGINSDGLKYAAHKITKFAEWLSTLLNNILDLAADNTIQDVVPKLRRIAETTARTYELKTRQTRPSEIPLDDATVSQWRWEYAEALDSLARYMQQKTGKPRYTMIAKLLGESARALEKKQIYDVHTILVRINAHRRVKGHRSH